MEVINGFNIAIEADCKPALAKAPSHAGRPRSSPLSMRYRSSLLTLAVFLVDEGISPEDTEKVGEAVKSVKVSIAYDEQQVPGKW